MNPLKRPHKPELRCPFSRGETRPGSQLPGPALPAAGDTHQAGCGGSSTGRGPNNMDARAEAEICTSRDCVMYTLRCDTVYPTGDLRIPCSWTGESRLLHSWRAK